MKAQKRTRPVSATAVGHDIANLLQRYGCGPVQLTGNADALYERHRTYGQGPRRALPRTAGRVRPPYYTRIDAPATPEQKTRLEQLSPEAVTIDRLAGEPIRGNLTPASGDGVPIGGLKVVADNGWFAARPSGTENIYKIYAESFKDQGHLDAIVSEAQEIVHDALKSFDSAHQQQEAHS